MKKKESRIMFLGFSVSNFLSFNETQTISMMASKVVRHKEHILSGNGKRILKTGLIYGANAGGKSNLIRAIDFSTNHEGISQLAMKMGDWLHYCFGSLDL